MVKTHKNPTNIDYLNARYYQAGQGQFISEDPVFLGDPKQQNLRDPQSINTYSYSENNPITRTDADGKASLAGSLGLGYALGFESGPTDFFIGTGIGLTLFAGELYYDYEKGAPGNFQATKSVSGQGYNTDPNLPSGRPPGKSGGLIFSTITSAVIINAGTDYWKNYSDYGGGVQLAGNYLSWACQAPIMVNSFAYSQNINYSQTTSKASNYSPSSSTNGSNYVSQTYQVPSGAIIDWGGKVIVPAENSSTNSSNQSQSSAFSNSQKKHKFNLYLISSYPWMYFSR
jgi:RHS repeat-associated protein